MGIKQTVIEWKPMIESVIDSKVSEFLIMGYPKATSKDVWSCLEQGVWKGNPSKRLHEVVQDVFHLSANAYMSYLTVNAYQENDGLMASIAALTDGYRVKNE